MVLPLLSIIVLLFLLFLILYHIISALLERNRLLKDYQNISFLSLSPIPFIGNVHHFDKRSHVVFQLFCQLAKQAQDQNKGLFCFWFGLKPRLFLCSGQGLEVYSYPIISISKYFLFHLSSPLSVIANNLLNLITILFFILGLKLVYSLGNTSAIQTSYFLYH
jgi:hypothetical protein